MQLFTEMWAKAWRDRLNASPAYREAAAEWQGRVALVMRADETTPERAVYLETARGGCDAARSATSADLEQADYIFEAPAAVWRQVFRGAIPPAMAVLTGRLRLTRGSLGTLLPYVAAARELLASAAEIGGE